MHLLATARNTNKLSIPRLNEFCLEIGVLQRFGFRRQHALNSKLGEITKRLTCSAIASKL